MASTTSIKDTGILRLLLIGLLLPSLLVSGQITTSNTDTIQIMIPTNSSTLTQTVANTSSPGTTLSTVYTTNGGTVTTIIQSPTSTSGGSSSSTTQSPISTSKGIASSNTLSAALTSGGSSSSTTQALTSTSKGTASSNTLSAALTSGGSSSSTTQALTSTSRGSTSSTTLSLTSTSKDVTNGTTMSNSTSKNMTYLYCPSFSCSSSECYSMYISRNATLCAAGCCCQLLRSMDMWYNVSCSASCADSCINTTQTNCSMNCCNSTGCLSHNFESMMITTTMASTTTKTSQSTSTTTSTTVDNGNKCSSGSCNGDSCYSTFKTLQTCSSSQPHCQLRKDSTNSIITWTAGCTNCTGLAACSSGTQPPCVLECCKASKTSCLLLNGTLNVPTSAARGPFRHTELIISSFCLLAVTLLF